MPRGIPASGQRRTRSQAAEPGIVETDAPVAVHDPQVGDDAPAEVPVEPTPVPAPGDDLTPEPVPDLTPVTPVTPVPTPVPTPEQIEIKRLRDRLAQSEGRKEHEPEIEDISASDENIVIHFLEDGLTALGKVWYRGDELEFAPNSQAYKDTCDRNGRSWLSLRSDEFGQVDRWGKVMFRNGPWPGKTYADGKFEAMRSDRDPNVSIKPPSEEELAAAEKARARRAAPKLPATV